MMDCDWVKHRFLEFSRARQLVRGQEDSPHPAVDDELTHDDRVGMEEHLARCQDCESYFQREESKLDGIRSVQDSPQELSPDFTERLLSLIQPESVEPERIEPTPPLTRVPSTIYPSRRWVRPVAAAAAVLLMASLFLLLDEGGTPSEPSSVARVTSDGLNPSQEPGRTNLEPDQPGESAPQAEEIHPTLLGFRKLVQEHADPQEKIAFLSDELGGVVEVASYHQGELETLFLAANEDDQPIQKFVWAKLKSYQGDQDEVLARILEQTLKTASDESLLSHLLSARVWDRFDHVTDRVIFLALEESDETVRRDAWRLLIRKDEDRRHEMSAELLRNDLDGFAALDLWGWVAAGDIRLKQGELEELVSWVMSQSSRDRVRAAAFQALIRIRGLENALGFIRSLRGQAGLEQDAIDACLMERSPDFAQVALSPGVIDLFVHALSNHRIGESTRLLQLVAYVASLSRDERVVRELNRLSEMTGPPLRDWIWISTARSHDSEYSRCEEVGKAFADLLQGEEESSYVPVLEALQVADARVLLASSLLPALKARFQTGFSHESKNVQLLLVLGRLESEHQWSEVQPLLESVVKNGEWWSRLTAAFLRFQRAPMKDGNELRSILTEGGRSRSLDQPLRRLPPAVRGAINTMKKPDAPPTVEALEILEGLINGFSLTGGS